MQHTICRAILLGLTLSTATAHAAEPEAPRDYLAEFNALRASIDAPPADERSAHTDFLAVADAIKEEERRRSRAMLAAHPDEPYSLIDFSIGTMSAGEAVNDGYSKVYHAAALGLLEWYAASPYPAQVAQLVRNGPPTLPETEKPTVFDPDFAVDAGLRSALRNIAIAEMSRAELLAERGDHAGHVATVENLLAFDTMFSESPGALADLVRMSVLSAARNAVVSPIERGHFDPASAPRLMQLMHAAESRHFALTRHHLRGERLTALQMLTSLYALAETPEDRASLPDRADAFRAIEGHFDDLDAYFAAPGPAANIPKDGLTAPLDTFAAAGERYARSVCLVLAGLRAGRLALAVESYRHDTGALPETLDALVEASHLDELPANPMSDDPTFGYTLDDRSPTGYTLAVWRSLEHNEPFWIVPVDGVDAD